MNRTKMERIRLGLMLVAGVLFLGLAIARLVQFQIVDADRFSSIVERQSTGRIPIPAERGMIYDRYGRVVAKNVTRLALYAHPSSQSELTAIAAYLDKAFDLRAGTALKKYKLEVNRFRWIDRRLDDRLADRIEKDAPPGLHLRTEMARQYPFGLVGRQVLGYTNIDNEGLSGFELLYDSALSGVSGFADISRDGQRNTYRIREQALLKPEPGQSIVLTLDWQLQEIVEQELAAAVDSFNAQLGMAAFLDVATGEILAIAHFDPSEKDPAHPTKLYPISDQFEPGSAFKPFTAAALLDAGVIDFNQMTYCENGLWHIGRRTLADDKKHGFLNFRQIIELSSNIGLGKWAQAVEGPVLIDTYRKFGFGKRTGLGFPGETKGSLHPPQVWSDYNVAALAMGHSVATTCLQMANAMASIANGGRLYEPRLVLGEVDDDGYVRRFGEPKLLGTPLSPVSADTLRTFMRGVVEVGTGKAINSEFVNIAGKTGTAELPNLEQGGYYKHKFMASFCGFFPAEAPVIAGIVALKDPKPVTYGGLTSGKAFRHIAERYTVSHQDLFAASERVCDKRETPATLTVNVPNFVGRDVYQARLLARNMGVNIRADSLHGVVVWQYPAADRQILRTDEVVIAVVPPGRKDPIMIDLRGETIRRATAFLEFVGMDYTIVGSGCVCEQSVPPGEPVRADTTCRLVCGPSRERSDSLTSSSS